MPLAACDDADAAGRAETDRGVRASEVEDDGRGGAVEDDEKNLICAEGDAAALAVGDCSERSRTKGRRPSSSSQFLIFLCGGW